MAYEVKQGNIFGRLGTGIGKGLADQVPKEIDRYRLSEGLKNLGENGEGLTPFQQYAQLAAIPGITPQMIQSGSELLKQQGIKNSLMKNTRRSKGTEQEPYESRLQDIQSTQLGGDRFNRKSPMGKETPGKNLPSDYPSEEKAAQALPGAVTTNPYEKKFEHKGAWTPEQKMDDIASVMEQFPNSTYEEAKRKSDENEARDLAQPVDALKRRNDRLETEAKTDTEFDNQLQTALQKEGKDVYGDITGETLLNLKKAMRNDLATNPGLTEKTAAEKWVKKATNLAKTKQEVKTLANRGIWDKISPLRKEETIKKLKQAAKIFNETGNKEELYNILKSKNTPPTFDNNGNVISPGSYGFDLSAGESALISYDRSDKVKEYIKSTKPLKDLPINQLDSQSRKIADEVAKNLTYNDSILAIAKELKDKDPYFNEISFFDYLRENQDKYGFNSRMKKELLTGSDDILPTWGDIALFPAFGKSRAHD